MAREGKEKGWGEEVKGGGVDTVEVDVESGAVQGGGEVEPCLQGPRRVLRPYYKLEEIQNENRGGGG